MERVRRHVHIADQVFAGKIDTHDRDLNAELIFLHFRKALEELAFASLAANREKYSAARAGFATEWNARRMLGFVEKVNPNFYPVPLKPPQATAPGHKFFDSNLRGLSHEGRFRHALRRKRRGASLQEPLRAWRFDHQRQIHR
jgi:hypothetical protein